MKTIIIEKVFPNAIITHNEKEIMCDTAPRPLFINLNVKNKCIRYNLNRLIH